MNVKRSTLTALFALSVLGAAPLIPKAQPAPPQVCRAVLRPCLAPSPSPLPPPKPTKG